MGDLPRLAKKIVLPRFTLTETCDATDEGATAIVVPAASTSTIYYERSKLAESNERVDGKPVWKPSRFNLYPIVLDNSGLPWPEANVYILSRLENTPNPDMSNFDGIADDLVAFRKYLDDDVIDWRKFPKQKLSRPTYRYSAFLERAIGDDEISASLAARRLRSVIAFYNWMKNNCVFIPENEPWQEKKVLLNLKRPYGAEFIKAVPSTDIAIKVPRQEDPYDGTINDGGKLRPLSIEEQGWVLEALIERGNTEMTLIHLLALASGARIQTVLTFRVRNLYRLAAEQLRRPSSTEIRIPVGPGTGIDTKGNKQMNLHIPLWFYRMLLTYMDSDRARRRRCLAAGGDTPDQYFFLTKYGDPFYSGKRENRNFDSTSKRRQPCKGNAVRKFIADYILPYIRAKYDTTFHYRFHDLRASYGMNLTDSQLTLVAEKKITLNNAREFVRIRLGHESIKQTDRYVQFRDNLAQVVQVTESYDLHLRLLTEKVGI